jgi:hypothetical protein
VDSDPRADLRIVGDLLARYANSQANFVHRLAAETDDDRFWSDLAGLEMWGGSGAVWEVEPFHYSHPREELANIDYETFQRSLVRLARVLEDRGLGALASRNAKYLERQLATDEST